MRMTAARLPAALLGLLCTAGPAFAQTTSEFQGFLESVGGFDEGDLRDLESGKVVVHTLSSDNDEEVAVMAVVRTTMTLPTFRNLAQIVGDALADGSVVSVGKFSQPAVWGDLRGLVMPDELAEELSRCTPGDCKVKVTADLLGRLQALDATAPNHAEEVDSILARTFLAYVNAYVERGNEALLVFDDKPEPQAVRDALTELLSESRYLYRRFPELHRYLQNYPRGNDGRFEDVLFWEVQDLGLRPVVELEHRTLFSPDDAEVRAMAVTKRIFSTHYFLAALEIGALVEPLPSASVTGRHLVYVARFRFDGRVTGLRRHEVRSKLEGIVKRRLEAVRVAAEGVMPPGDRP